MLTTPWETLRDRCAGAAEAVIVAPYIKADALTMVLDQLHPEAELECITRWTPLDIQMGASDLECRSLVLSQGGTFRLHNRLHAKYYRFDKKVLVGSANMTASGLSLGFSGNLEILCEPGPSFCSVAFERGLRQQSREVTDDEYLSWTECPVDRRITIPAGQDPPGNSLVDWRPQTRLPAYLWLSYSGNDARIASPDQRRLAELEVALLGVPPGLEVTAFANWVRSSLFASPFVDSIRSLSSQRDEAIWDTVAEEWGVTRSEASRWVSTAQNWLKHFDPGTRT